MKNEEYIIIHGLGGSPKEHWQNFLYQDLEARGKKVLFPQFPNNTEPSLELWLSQLHSLKKHIHENTIIIAHSMGVILWLHYISRYKNIKVKKSILVAPPSKDFLLSHQYAKSFSEFILDAKNFHHTNMSSLLIATNNDKYCIPKAQEIFGKVLNLPYLELPPEAGHINIDSGYGKWEDLTKYL